MERGGILGIIVDAVCGKPRAKTGTRRQSWIQIAPGLHQMPCTGAFCLHLTYQLPSHPLVPVILCFGFPSTLVWNVVHRSLTGSLYIVNFPLYSPLIRGYYLFLFLIKHFFIAVQLQLSAFSPYDLFLSSKYVWENLIGPSLSFFCLFLIF